MSINDNINYELTITSKRQPKVYQVKYQDRLPVLVNRSTTCV